MFSASSNQSAFIVHKEQQLAKRRYQWMFAIKVLFIFNMIWQTANIVVAFVNVNLHASDFQIVSNNGFFFRARLSGCTAMVFFLVTGIIIRKKI